MGTAGYSPQQGGVIDTLRGCDAANPSTAITREGDLCITPWAINWDCKLTDWDDQCAGFPNVCRCFTQTLEYQQARSVLMLIMDCHACPETCLK